MPEAIHHFLPGPSYVLAEVREAMLEPPIAHRSAAFKEVYAVATEGLKPIFRTTRDVLIASGSSTLGMEIAVASTIEKKVLNLVCGAFSERWHTICRAHGLDAEQLAVPWGEIVDPDRVRSALRRKRYDAVTLAHSETSTGVLNPLADIARTVREESDALVLVDAVSSLGGARVETDAWGLDVVVTGSQKALALPPGLALLSASERAFERAATVEGRGFYTDLLRYRDAHRDGGSTITTPAEAQIYALALQVGRVAAEGIENRWARHLSLRSRLEAWVRERDLTYASVAEGASPTISCLRPSPTMPAPRLVAELARRGYTVAGGYGAWKAETFRIGHMGEVTTRNLDALLTVLDQVLSKLQD